MVHLLSYTPTKRRPGLGVMTCFCPYNLRQFAADSPCISANSRLNLSGLSTLLAPGTLFTRRRVHGHLGLEGLPHLRTYLDPDPALFRRARRAYQLEPASRSLPLAH